MPLSRAGMHLKLLEFQQAGTCSGFVIFFLFASQAVKKSEAILTSYCLSSLIFRAVVLKRGDCQQFMTRQNVFTQDLAAKPYIY